MKPHRSLVSGVLAGSLLLASPARGAPPSEGVATEETVTIEQAIENGDLGTARDLAVAARERDPSPANWLAEADVHEALGDLGAAAEAYRGYLRAAPVEEAAAERADVEARLDALEERARGAVADEPASTHREDLDAARAQRQASTQLKPAPAPAPAPEPEDRVVKKWYFWVTLAAIAGAAGAVTAISIKAANQERKDALDRSPAGPTGPGGGVLFRF